jgi:hypothetical protein
MRDFLLNKDFSMLEVPSSELIPLETKGVTVMRKLTLTFNLENKTFDLGYLNYTKDSKNVRNSYVHTYYLALDSRLASFIAFLQDKYREQNSQVDNIVQVSLKVSVNPTGGIYYTLIMKGDRTVPLSFKPSEFKDHENEIDPTFAQCMEPLIESILSEKEEKIISTLTLYFLEKDQKTYIAELKYSKYEIFEKRNTKYTVLVNDTLLKLLNFLRKYYTFSNNKIENIHEIYLLVYSDLVNLVIYDIEGNYERVSFIPFNLVDSDTSHTVLFSYPLSQESKKDNKELTIEQQIISIGKELEEIKLLRDKKIKQLKDLVDNYDLRTV